VNEATTAECPPARDLQVLILEPDEKVAMQILSALEEAAPGTRARAAGSLGEAQRLVADQRPSLFVLDVDAAYEMGQEFIYDLRTSHPNARAIILTAIHFAAQRERMAGLGAIHFLEKPFPRADFITLTEALLPPAGGGKGERFQGMLSDLHVADIIQLKCISGATSMLEFTGPNGEKARVYFENGQVRHAIAPGKEGLEAFNAIVDWKGGHISEVAVPPGTPHTIDLDWQVLLMEAVRKIDESRSQDSEMTGETSRRPKMSGHNVLVIDDSIMLLSFVKEILEEQGYDVRTAATGAEGVQLCRSELPDLVLLDFVLPDMKGDEVCRRLIAIPETAKVPVVYISGFGSDLKPDRNELPNLIGLLNKPFTSDALLAALRNFLPGEQSMGTSDAAALPTPLSRKVTPPPSSERQTPTFVPPVGNDVLATNHESNSLNTPVKSSFVPEAPSIREVEPAGQGSSVVAGKASPPGREQHSQVEQKLPDGDGTDGQTHDEEPTTTNAYFCGDSSFFSLHWALQTIAREKLTGILRAFWSRDSVELLARDGRVVVVTTRNPVLYCEESPVTLLNVPSERVEAARERQAKDGCPIFVTLANEGLVLHEPGMQLVQHYGQKLFSQLWTDRVRFTFEKKALPGYANELPTAEESIDQWALSTLRFVQYQELGERATVDALSVPAYTRDGFDRVQELRLTVAEAQFASQFNGNRSIAQISKNLRLDIKFARLTLFRFLALEIVECWPVQVSAKPESRGSLRGIFGR
jgi:DNA-binding response OmpR family regulator